MNTQNKNLLNWNAAHKEVTQLGLSGIAIGANVILAGVAAMHGDMMLGLFSTAAICIGSHLFKGAVRTLEQKLPNHATPAPL